MEGSDVDDAGPSGAPGGSGPPSRRDRPPDPPAATAPGPPVPWANAAERAALAAGQRLEFRVTGDSMTPTLEAGDVVLVDPGAYSACDPTPGEVILSGHPFKSDMRWVKRVAHVDEAGRCDVRGDNPAASTDSRTQGRVPRRKVMGRVTSRRRD